MEASGLRHAPAALDKAKNTVLTEQDARFRGRGKKSLTATGIRTRSFTA